jgi:8-oxo-dGTP pyrophosphatase MutT (NUDIX family)
VIIMGQQLSERVGAFILRKRHVYELLLFRHPDTRDASIQIPGGGVEAGESIEEALYREIYEESGLKDLTLIRKIGESRRCWLDTNVESCRHYFLLEVKDAPDRWDHCVHGEGIDAGLIFSYYWHRPAIGFVLPKSSGQVFLNSRYIPELFE